jgi:hypothetical protein
MTVPGATRLLHCPVLRRAINGKAESMRQATGERQMAQTAEGPAAMGDRPFKPRCHRGRANGCKDEDVHATNVSRTTEGRCEHA